MELQATVQLVLLALIGIAVVPLTVYAIGFVREKYKQVRASVGEQNFYIIDQLVDIVVKAAEQAKLKEAWEASGEQMLAWAVDQLQAFLDARGITGISVGELEQRIRAALRDGVHKADEPIPPPAPVPDPSPPQPPAV